MKLTALCVRYPTLALIALALVMVWGAQYFFTMSRREDPDITVRGAQIVTIYPGALPEDVEQYVTSPLEDIAREIPEVKETASFSRNSVSVLWINLEDSVSTRDIPQIWDKLRAKINLMQGSLPRGCGTPALNDEFFDTCSHVIAVASPALSPRELAALAHRVRDRLSALPAAGRVSVVAEQPEAIYLEFDPGNLTSYGISSDQIISLLQAQNDLVAGGSLDLEGDSYTIDATGAFTSLEQIRALPLLVTPQGQQLRLGDLGRVRYGYQDPPQMLARVNGMPAVVVSVVMKSGKNVIELGRQVTRELQAMRADLPVGIELVTVQDQPREVNQRVDLFLSNLRDGIWLVVLIVVLLLGLRAALPIAIAIPLNMVCTFAVLSLMHTDLQQMSIAALIIGLGMIVDDSVVVTDNIRRYIQLGHPAINAALKATGEVAVPVLTSTLTTVFGFAPLLGLVGDSGSFVRDIPVVVSISLLVSYVLSIAIVPLVASRVFKNLAEKPREALLLPLVLWLQERYPGALRWTQRHRGFSLALLLIALTGSLALFPFLGVQFFPGAERDQFVIDIYAPEGTAIEETARIADGVEQQLIGKSGIQNYVSYIGQGGPRFYYNVVPETLLSSYAQVVVNTDSPQQTAQLVKELTGTLSNTVPGARIEVKILEQGPPVGAPLQIVVRGPELVQLKRISEEIQSVLNSVDGVTQVRDNFGKDSYLLKLVCDDIQLRSAGLTSAQVKSTTAFAMSGVPLTGFRAPERQIPIIARVMPELRQSAADINRLCFRNPSTGLIVPFAAVARIETQRATSQIERLDGERQLRVSAFVTSNTLPSAVLQSAKPLIDAIKLPPGYKLLYRGEAEESAEAFGGLGKATVVALLLILLMLVVEFKSLRIALAIYLSVPLAFIGAVFGLYITGWSFGFIAGLGFMALAGIVVKNAIVLVDFIMQALREGLPLQDALAQAGQVRMRPIILTSATTILGLLPLGLFGGSMWAPMCFAVIFGLLVSTLLTMFVIPLLFTAIAGKAALKLTQRAGEE